MRRLLAFALFALVWPLGVAGAPLKQVNIQEWSVPWSKTRPRDPFAEATDRIWFVGQGGDYIGRLDPTDGEFKRYDLPQGTGPHSLIVDDAGYVWFAANGKGYIGKLDPESGKITKFPMPDKRAADPHTLVFDSAGNIWFTVQGGNFIGRLSGDTDTIKLIPVPTPDARPYGIVIGPQDRPWFAEFGSNKIATIDTDTLKVHEFTLPRSDARPRRIAIASDGSVWYVDYAQGYLGRFDPATGTFREWPAPAGAGSKPYGMAIDNQDHVWFVETGPQPNHLVGFDPSSERFISDTAIPSGGGAVRNMFFYEPTGALWFGTDTDTIARARIGTPAP